MKTHHILSLMFAGTLLAGCGLSEEDFQSQYFDSACSLTIECLGKNKLFTSVDQCVDYMNAAAVLIPENCVYDAASAKDCLDWIDGATCDDATSDESNVCDDVYQGEGCGSDTGA
jgi:hypothetical protein